MIVREIQERSTDGPATAPEQPKAPMKGGFPAPRRRARPPPTCMHSPDRPNDVDTRDIRLRNVTTASGEPGWTDPVPHINFQTPYPAESSGQARTRILYAPGGQSAGNKLSEVESVLSQVDEENWARVEEMSNEEREEEKRELVARFGGGLVGLMERRRRLRNSRDKQGVVMGEDKNKQERADEVESVRKEVGAGNEAKVQRMNVGDWTEEVRELEERFGKTTLAALRRRAEKRQARTVEMCEEGSWVNAPDLGPSRAPPWPRQQVLDEPTDPKSLKRYFPNTPAEPAKLAWLQPSTTPSDDTSIRFDLSGNVLSAEEMRTRSTSEGLHHHGASPDLAGYTIDDILMLSRSTVPSQRILMLGLLARILGAHAADTLPVAARTAVEKADARRIGVQLGINIIVASSRSRGLLEAGVGAVYQGLGGETWTFLDDVGIGHDQFRPEGDDGGIGSIPFDELTENFADLLLRAGLQPLSVRQMLRILRRGVYLSQETAEIIRHAVPRLVRHLALKSPVPLVELDLPSMDVLRLLEDLINASRKCAAEVAETDLVASLLRFLVVSTWSEGASLDSQYATITLRILASLGRYGLSVGIVSSALDVFRPLGEWTTQAYRTAREDGLIEAYWRCLTIWTVCAIDPHKTTPEHALTWAQVSAFGWHEEATEAIASLSSTEGKSRALTAVLEYLNAWLEGLGINAADSDARDQRRGVATQLRTTNLGGLSVSLLNGTINDVSLLEQVLRLHSLLRDRETPAVLSPQHERLLVASMLPNLCADYRHLGYRLLPVAKEAELCTAEDFVRYTLDMLMLLRAGEEPEALDLVDQLLQGDLSALPDLANDMTGIGHRDQLQILRPLLHHAILPGADHVVGPRTPSQTYLKATTTLFRPADSRDIGRYEAGLPLNPGWLFAPLDELLDSASSEAIKQSPPDWDASELDIVRATLLLARLQLALKPGGMSRPAVLFGSMKVFMLERDSQSAGDHPEVFRDDHVVKSLDALIGLYTGPSDDVHTAGGDTIETVAQLFLGPDMPFYQFYQDFLALFEAISYSDKRFTQMIVLPLSMRYPTDFRKLLWVEQPAALRSIRISLADVPKENGDLGGFFRPAETDADVLAGYTRALASGWVTPHQEFLWRIATWHLASLFWRDTGGKEREEVKKALMRAIVLSPKMDVAREVVGLDVPQTASGSGGRCGQEELKKRLQAVGEMLGNDVRKRLEQYVTR